MSCLLINKKKHKTCCQSPPIKKSNGFGGYSGHSWYWRVQAEGFFNAHCSVWNFAEILPENKTGNTLSVSSHHFYVDIFKIKAYQSMVSLPSKTCIISSLHSFWCSGWQARLYRRKEMPLAVVSWPSNMNVSTSARMSSSERPCWFSSWKIKYLLANCHWCYWTPPLTAPTSSFR